jgi:uncharacterized protein
MKFWPAVLALSLIIQGCASTGSALHQAVLKGDKTQVTTLLDKGAKIDARNSRGCTALYLAAENCNPELVQVLLDHKADFNKGALLKHGNTPLHIAAQNGCDTVIEALLKSIPTNRVDLQNSLNQTPLMLAAWSRHPKTVTLLLKHGADPTVADRYGCTALHTPWDAKPADSDYSAVMEILVAYKAPVNAQARVPLGYTPLIGACMVGDKDTVELLLDAGAHVNDIDHDGQTAYSIAAYQRFTEVMSVLAEHGGTRHNPITPDSQQTAPTEPTEPVSDSETQ